jgi:hypothetical protein
MVPPDDPSTDTSIGDGPLPFSRDALYLFAVLDRHGGTLRMRPLLTAAGLADGALGAAINELAERSWVKVTWRAPHQPPPAGVPERFREVERVTTTSFGRWRYPATVPRI